MKASMFGRVLIWVCFFFGNNPVSQAADTLKINQTVKHWVDSTGRSQKKMTIKQQFYTLDDTLFREINYSETTGQIISYMFYFYTDGRLFTQEKYNVRDSLLFILKHEYDQVGNEVLLTKFIPGSVTLFAAEKTINTYNTNHQLLQQKTFFGKRVGALTRNAYSQSGLPVSVKSTYKPIAKAPVKQESKIYSYTSDSKISQVLFSGKDISGKPYHFKEVYFYNEKGQLTNVKKVGTNDTFSGEKIYKYHPSGNLKIYEEHDSEGKVTLVLQYEYMKHIMNRGIQVSYYENL